jgi:hypothetical protein
MRATVHTELKVDPDGLRELLTSREVAEDLDRRGQAVAAAARHQGVTVEGEPGKVPLPIVVHTETTGSRARTTVVADHPSGLAVEAKHRLLGGALDAARR